MSLIFAATNCDIICVIQILHMSIRKSHENPTPDDQVHHKSTFLLSKKAKATLARADALEMV